ncbi:XRE family transcriptional regulator [Flagellimonas sp. 389]|uniref:helix-turn-helix domain-containing protein n=1 Tax=Flagellimonas sp. 389 TaxID=2835862 RepID=UPI001BD2DCF7|nr:helix-turn-helix domain-containing protein [Flagellimonas sp. 389]MBS9461033.1 XRE family transcriptional regulator [Flagellimonas sp. 389]
MTKIGSLFLKKSVKKADISRKTGISSSRLSLLSREESTKLTAREAFLIALAIDISPADFLEELYGHLKLNK